MSELRKFRGAFAFALLWCSLSITFLNASEVNYDDRLDSLQLEIQIANVLLKKGRHVDCVEGLLMARSRSSKLGIPSLEAKACWSLGEVYQSMAQYGRASEYYMEGAALYDSLGLPETVAQLMIEVGLCYKHQGNFVKAVAVLKKARLNFRLIAKNRSKVLARIYLEQAALQLEMGNNTLASILADSAIDLAANDLESVVYGNALLVAAETQFKLEKLEKAGLYIEQAMLLARENRHRIEFRADVHTLNASLLIAQGKLDDAEEELQLADTLCDAGDLIRKKSRLCLVWVEFYVKQGQYEKGAEYYRKRDGLVEAIRSRQDSVQLVNSKIANELIQLEAKVQLQDLTDQAKEQKDSELLKYRLTMGGAAIALIILIGFVATFRFRVKKLRVENQIKRNQLEQERLENMIKFKNTELSNFGMYIVRKNEYIQSLKTTIDELRSNGFVLEDLKNLSSSIDEHIESDTDAEEFNKLAEEINQNFYDKLDARHPDLTVKERKLCSLLFIGLSSKEISEIQKITVGSVEKGRYRLRKKLSLDSSISFDSYFKTL